MKLFRVLLACAITVLLAVTACACTCSACAPAETYSVIFDTKGGSAIEPYELAAGEKIVKPADPEKEMFTFNGWYKDEACTEEFKFDTEMPANDITVYADWIAGQSVRVTFDANGGQFEGSATEIYSIGGVGSAFAAPQTNPVNAGYAFGGWYTEPECLNKYAFDKYPEAELTLYAKWNTDTAAFAYINYYGNGAFISQTVVEKGAKSEEPKLFGADVVNTGWYTDEAMTAAYSFGGTVTDVLNLYTTYYTEGLKIVDGTVTGFTGDSLTVTVPNVYEGKAVTEIGAYAFYRSSEVNFVNTIVLPATVTKIAEGAFYDCRYLVSVNLTDKVTELGAYAFYNNQRLKTYGDISSVKEISEGTFLGCENMTRLVLSDEVTAIGEKAFANCESLTEFTVPSGVKIVADYLFSGCKSLKTVEIKAPVLNSIGKCAFENCKALEKVVISSVIRTTFGGVAEGGEASPFSGCDEVTIYVPASVLEAYRGAYGYLDDDTLAGKFAAII